MNTLIAPSLLAANFLNLEEELKKIDDSKADWLHLDVMDGVFVPNISFGPDIIKQLSTKTDIFFDVHLMIIDPKKYYMHFIKSRANLITFHYEVMKNNDEIFELISLIKKENCLVGISINPDTNIEVLLPFLKEIDVVLIMSVNPGFGGQKFITNSIDKISFLDKYKKENNLEFMIEVDGGVTDQNCDELRKVGCNILVAGSYLFKDDMNNKINILRG